VSRYTQDGGQTASSFGRIMVGKLRLQTRAGKIYGLDRMPRRGGRRVSYCNFGALAASESACLDRDPMRCTRCVIANQTQAK
jgi:hypothetical protein